MSRIRSRLARVERVSGMYRRRLVIVHVPYGASEAEEQAAIDEEVGANDPAICTVVIVYRFSIVQREPVGKLDTPAPSAGTAQS